MSPSRALRLSATRITISHPRLAAWASLGGAVRISLRSNPVTVTMGGDDAAASQIAIRPVSGPFVCRADPQQDD